MNSLMEKAMKSENEMEELKKRINDFIQGRLEVKLTKLPPSDKKRQQIIEEYQPKNWIANAARRAAQIQLVTHAIKFQHPDAKGTSIYLDAPLLENAEFVSSRALPPEKRYSDVVGNAACLDVYKFLQLSLNGERLLERIIRKDSALYAAFPGKKEEKEAWFKAFANIKEASSPPIAHELMKQIYFPVGDESYHLITPLFPTSLAQAVYQRIQQDRTSEEAQEARKAKKENKPHSKGYRDYPNLAIRRFGGSKPQNISQGNSDRKGRAYLLSSQPPRWKSQKIKPPLQAKSIFEQLFSYRVRDLTKELKDFLIKVQKHNNFDIRQKRDDLVTRISDELLSYAAEIRQLKPGWSAHPDCKLSEAQAFWLDSKRALEDKEWGKKRNTTNWKSLVCDDFGYWLNNTLQTKTLRFGDDEHNEWKKKLKKELSLLKEIL